MSRSAASLLKRDDKAKHSEQGAVGAIAAVRQSRGAALAAFRAVRGETEARAAHLSAEDQVVQSMPDASPTKWHRAHVTWFFETISAACRICRATGRSTNAFRSCSIPITSPRDRAMRGRSAA